MNRFAEVMRGEETVLAATLTAHIEDAGAARDLAREVDVVEFRADYFPPGRVEDQITATSQLLVGRAILLTARHPLEGGKQDFGEVERKTLLYHMLPFVDAVDIELKSKLVDEVVQEAHYKNKPVIVSTHNFRATPSMGRLEGLLHKSQDVGANHVKIATTLSEPDDLSRLIAFTEKHRESGITVIGMSGDVELGQQARLELAKAGSKIMYASATNVPIAPGQMTYTQAAIKLDELGLRKRKNGRVN